MSNGLSKSFNMACFVSFSERLAGHQSPRQIVRDGTALLQLADYPPYYRLLIEAHGDG